VLGDRINNMPVPGKEMGEMLCKQMVEKIRVHENARDLFKVLRVDIDDESTKTTVQKVTDVLIGATQCMGHEVDFLRAFQICSDPDRLTKCLGVAIHVFGYSYDDQYCSKSM